MGKAWKNAERQAAALLGGRRHVRAHRGESAGDVDMPEGSNLSVEVKYRKAIPRLIVDGLAQARANAHDGQAALLVVKQRGQKGALAVLDLGDLVKLTKAPVQETDDMKSKTSTVPTTTPSVVPTPPGNGRPDAPAAPSPLLVDAREVARLLGVSLASIWRWRSAGKVPAPIRIGGTLRWRRDAIEAWVKDGCPDSGR